MKTDWIRVKKHTPCPICQKPDYCLIAADGTAAICARISTGGKVVGEKGAGWLHRLVEDQNRPKYKPKPKEFKPEKIPNWFKLVLQAQNNLKDLSSLSAELGVSCQSLARLNVGWFRNCYTFPMRDANNSFVGIRMRGKNKKFSVKGSKNAIFWPLGVEMLSPNILFICEGPTDTAALLDLGLDAIGRASCNTGFSYIRDMIQMFHREVVIVGDRDEAKTKPDGTVYYPGQEGAKKLALDLKPYCRHIRMIKPPDNKDMRAWYKSGATKNKVMLLVEQAKFI